MSENLSAGCAAGAGSACNTGTPDRSGACPGQKRPARPEEEAVRERMGQIRHKLVVLSGKGGVGKSTVAVNLAVSLARKGLRVGLLDADIHGPSLPTMLASPEQSVSQREGVLEPAVVSGLKVMSIGFLLSNPDEALIWRGPMKMGVLRQFLGDVAWGELDWLIIDSPPGTGDEPLSICQLVGGMDGAIVVTTPQAVAAVDVRKSLTFCRTLGLRVLGLIENMSGFVCPSCGTVTEVFGSGAGEAMARDFGVPLLARIPMDPRVRIACDEGVPFVTAGDMCPTATAFSDAASALVRLDRPQHAPVESEEDAAMSSESGMIRLAVPVADGQLCLHFGHCASFALVDADRATGEIHSREDVPAPDHQPGLLPRWLAERGVQVVIAGGMGQRAQQLFAEQGIQVVTGAVPTAPEDLAAAYLAGALRTGENVCDH